LAFPRFFFVSDTVLLEILSQKNDPKAILPHLKTIFDNIYRYSIFLFIIFYYTGTKMNVFIFSVSIDAKARKLTAMQSGEGESVDFSYAVVADGNIEDWLLLLETEMKRTMKDVIRRAARDCFAMKLPEFIEKYPAQVFIIPIYLSCYF
jgi:dynein heavy chain, axonemal